MPLVNAPHIVVLRAGGGGWRRYWRWFFRDASRSCSVAPTTRAAAGRAYGIAGWRKVAADAPPRTTIPGKSSSAALRDPPPASYGCRRELARTHARAEAPVSTRCAARRAPVAARGRATSSNAAPRTHGLSRRAALLCVPRVYACGHAGPQPCALWAHALRNVHLWTYADVFAQSACAMRAGRWRLLRMSGADSNARIYRAHTGRGRRATARATHSAVHRDICDAACAARRGRAALPCPPGHAKCGPQRYIARARRARAGAARSAAAVARPRLAWRRFGRSMHGRGAGSATGR